MRRRHYTEDESGIDFTAILDIAFVVMVLFFGATVYLVESGRVTAEDGVMTAGREAPVGPPVHVTIDATGLLSIDGRPMERSLFEDSLARATQGRTNVKVVIDSHPDAGRESLTVVLDAVRAAQIEFIEVNSGEES